MRKLLSNNENKVKNSPFTCFPGGICLHCALTKYTHTIASNGMSDHKWPPSQKLKKVNKLKAIEGATSDYTDDSLQWWSMDCLVNSYRFLWRSGWRPLRRSLRSFPLRQVWTRSSTPWQWLCPSWPGPGRSRAVPHGRRSRNDCCHSVLVPLKHSWSEGSGLRGEKEDYKSIVHLVACISQWPSLTLPLCLQASCLHKY